MSKRSAGKWVATRAAQVGFSYLAGRAIIMGQEHEKSRQLKLKNDRAARLARLLSAERPAANVYGLDGDMVDD